MPTKKIIRIPEEVGGFDEVISDYRSIIDSPDFQRLRWIKSCDLVFEIYPGMTNTRFEHSLGTVHEMRGIIDGICKEDSAYRLDRTEKATLELAALLHDIGHSGFSHAVEQLLVAHGQPDHDEKSLEKIERMEESIRKIPDVNFSMLQEIFRRRGPFWPMVWSYVGADPLDYISRDAMHSGVKIASEPERIKTFAFFDGDRYGIETKAMKVVSLHLDSWLTMYSEVYLRKLVNIYKGVLRTAFNELIKSGAVRLEDAWDMTDVEILAEMWKSKGLANRAYYIIRNREPPKTFLSVKIAGYEEEEETRAKPIHVHGMPEEDLTRILERFEDTESIMRFEREVESALGLSLGDITVAEMPHIKYIQPKDVNLYDKDRGWSTLYERKPRYKVHAKETAREIYVLRIATPPDLRDAAFKRAPEVAEMLASFA